MLAARGGHFSVVQFLAAAGADIHAADGAGETALLRASSGGFIDIVRFLHEKGAAADDVGALMGAAAGGHVDTLEFLLECGADIHAAPAPLEWTARGRPCGGAGVFIAKRRQSCRHGF